MNHLLRPRIWPSFQASSGVDPCDVPFRYASGPIPRYRGTVARWHAHLRGLATAIHEISGLGNQCFSCLGSSLDNFTCCGLIPFYHAFSSLDLDTGYDRSDFFQFYDNF
jgi:hypothetical protein